MVTPPDVTSPADELDVERLRRMVYRLETRFELTDKGKLEVLAGRLIRSRLPGETG